MTVEPGPSISPNTGVDDGGSWEAAGVVSGASRWGPGGEWQVVRADTRTPGPGAEPYVAVDLVDESDRWLRVRRWPNSEYWRVDAAGFEPRVDVAGSPGRHLDGTVRLLDDWMAAQLDRVVWDLVAGLPAPRIRLVSAAMGAEVVGVDGDGYRVEIDVGVYPYRGAISDGDHLTSVPACVVVSAPDRPGDRLTDLLHDMCGGSWRWASPHRLTVTDPTPHLDTPDGVWKPTSPMVGAGWVHESRPPGTHVWDVDDADPVEHSPRLEERML